MMTGSERQSLLSDTEYLYEKLGLLEVGGC